MDRKPAARRALAMPRSAIREIMNLAAGRDGWTRYSPNAGPIEPQHYRRGAPSRVSTVRASTRQPSTMSSSRVFSAT